MSRKTVLHVCWVLATLAVIGAVTVWMTVGGDREVLLIGATTDAHHQFELSCPKLALFRVPHSLTC